MTKEKNFKVGDYVRVKDSSRTGYIVDIDVCMDWQECKHIIYTIRGSYPDREPFYFYEFEDNLEPTEIAESKTAFITRLQSLLSQYGASFVAHRTDMPVSVYFKDNEAPSVSIGEEINKGCGVVVTPDNIMDFDKD